MTSERDEFDDSVEKLLDQARGGSLLAAGHLFDRCRGYLTVIANQRLDDALRAKIGGSDLVQQTLMHAHRDFGDFRGRTEGELLAWLQAIILNELATAKRRYVDTAKRDLKREVPITDNDGSDGRSSALPANTETPSQDAVQREDHARLHNALARLGELDRQVVELRNRDLLTFVEIGRRLSMSEEQARRTWARAIEKLRHALTPILPNHPL